MSLKSVITNTWRSLTGLEKWNSSYFYPVNGSSGLNWEDRNQRQNLCDFLQVPEVNTVINYRAWAQSLIILKVVSKTTEKEVSNNEPIVKALRKPNYFQTQKELWRQTELFRNIFGNEYIFFKTPVGMKRSVKGIYTLPPQDMEVFYPQNLNPFFFYDDYPDGIRYLYSWDGKKVPLDPDDIIHLNDNNVDQKKDNFLDGTSKLNGLAPNIENLRAAYEARNVILANRGAIGILSNNAKDGTGSTLPMNPTEKENLQNEFLKYGVLKRQWKFLMTNLTLRWQQITTDLDKLRVFEETEADFVRICNVFGVPYELFAGTNVTYENKEKAEKQFYQDTVIPTAQERIQAINTWLDTDNRSWQLVGSFDHLPIFQEDINERSQALNTLVDALNVALQDGAITIDQYTEELRKFKIGS